MKVRRQFGDWEKIFVNQVFNKNMYIHTYAYKYNNRNMNIYKVGC